MDMKARIVSDTALPAPTMVEVRRLPSGGVGVDKDGNYYVADGHARLVAYGNFNAHLFCEPHSIFDRRVTPLPKAEVEVVVYLNGKPAEPEPNLRMQECAVRLAEHLAAIAGRSILWEFAADLCKACGVKVKVKGASDG